MYMYVQKRVFEGALEEGMLHHKHECTHTHTFTHKHIHTHKYTYTHTHTHTHRQRCHLYKEAHTVQIRRALFQSHEESNGAHEQISEHNMGCVGEGRVQEQGMKGVLGLPPRKCDVYLCKSKPPPT